MIARDHSPATVAITGSSGLIGSALQAALRAKGHTVVRISRSGVGAGAGSRSRSATRHGKVEEETGGLRVVDRQGSQIDASWDIHAGRLPKEIFAGAGAVVHLAGAGIGDNRWTEARKKEILESRTLSTELMASTLAALDDPPAVFLSASAIGYYGNRGSEVLTEDSPGGTGFLAGVCEAWEAATAPAEKAGIRVVLLRTGIVQSPLGGMLKRLIPLFRIGLGSYLGDGRQYMSWISIADEVRAIEHAISHASLSGPVNLCSPNPVTAADYARSVAAVVGRHARLHVPAAVLRAAAGSEMASELLLSSQRALPAKLEATGFTFKWADLEEALANLLAGS